VNDMSQVGKFTMTTWNSGYPVWSTLSYEDTDIRGIHHKDLADLKYAVERAMKHAREVLPEKYRGEV